MPDEPHDPDDAAAGGQPDPGLDPSPDPGYDSSGVPTFDFVREKIESRYGTAIGATELDAESTTGRSIEDQYEERQRAAADRLAQIRESMRSDEG
jgi:phage shock protein A